LPAAKRRHDALPRIHALQQTTCLIVNDLLDSRRKFQSKCKRSGGR
jgi:hypothetical protein